MKELKDYVCTFEQAKKLKELGVELNSLFYWYFDKIVKVIDFDKFNEITNKIDFEVIVFDLHKFNLHKTIAGGLIPAFTYQEIEEIIYNIFGEIDFNSRHFEDGIISFFYDQEYFESKNHSQAMAEFLIYLLQQQKLENKNENETN